MSEHTLKSVTPKEAWQLMQDNPKAVLIDIRSEMEHLFIGHPKGSIHIPWIDEPDWQVNPNFVKQIRRVVLGGIIADYEDQENPVEGAPILLICRSGVRSKEAGRRLLQEGFNNVYNVVDGFEGPLDAHHHRSSVAGWRFDGLPWDQY